MIVIFKLSLEFKLEFLTGPTAPVVMSELERLSKFALICDEFAEFIFQNDLYTLVARAFEDFSSVLFAYPRYFWSE